MKDIIYLYDGTFEGFLTVVYSVFKRKILPKKIITNQEYHYNLFDKEEYIHTDFILSDKVFAGIKNISEHAMYNIFYAFLCDKNNKELIILDYIINLFRFKEKLIYMRNINSVLDVENMVKKVKREAHKFKGFVRFSKMENDIYYAKIEPDNDILEIVSRHFKKRLQNDLWIIEDAKRKVVSFYNKKDFVIVNKFSDIYERLIKTNKEIEYEQLWKCFFENVNIKERKNLRCQRNFMPKKYWKNILEVTK